MNKSESYKLMAEPRPGFTRAKNLNKLQYDRELKELQIKEIDELMKEYQRPIFDKDNIILIKNNYKIKYLELKNKFNNEIINKLKTPNRFNF